MTFAIMDLPVAAEASLHGIALEVSIGFTIFLFLAESLTSG